MVKKINKVITTSQREEIANLAEKGLLMLSFSSGSKPKVSHKEGGKVNSDAAVLMMQKGYLIPSSNDGLFKHTGQTLGLSETWSKRNESN